MGQIQNLDWGNIDWIFEPQAGSGDSMRVGISTMYPGTTQPRHVHSGDEQLMYILKGHGRQKIGDLEQPLASGKIYHISSGMSHEAMNDGDSDIVKLLISVPAVLPARQEQTSAPLQASAADTAAFLHAVVPKLAEEMLDPLKLPLSVFDAAGTLVYSNQAFPSFCRACCGIGENPESCRLYREKPVFSAPYYAKPSGFVCHYGLSLYAMPILCDGTLLGYLKAGHVRTSEPTVSEFPAALPYNVPNSTVTGILQIMEQLSVRICSHYRFNQVELSLEDSRRALSDQTAQEKLLQASLRTSQSKAMDLRINQHFLFNTLNMIMSLSIRENAFGTYDAVTNLAQLLQYTLRNTRYFVPLREELDYLKTYTNLQQMRFGTRLKVHYQVEKSVLKEDVPFNFLQPIAENSFQHGFVNQTDSMELTVQIRREQEGLLIQIRDNGCGMDADQLRALYDTAENGDGTHGTAMVLWKLRALYADNFHYEVHSEKGTCVTITIPAGGTNK